MIQKKWSQQNRMHLKKSKKIKKEKNAVLKYSVLKSLKIVNWGDLTE